MYLNVVFKYRSISLSIHPSIPCPLHTNMNIQYVIYAQFSVKKKHQNAVSHMVTDKKKNNEKRQICLIPFNYKYKVSKMFFIQLKQINTADRDWF